MAKYLVLLILAVTASLEAQMPDEFVLPAAEQRVLEAFFRSTRGQAWRANTGWLVTEKPCEWEGVRCEPTYEGAQRAATVIGLSLPFNNVSGELPLDFERLANLKFLDLRGNTIRGTFPERWLERWDRNDFELSIGGNRFSNLASKIRIEVSASGVRCSYEEDTHYFYEFAADGSVRFESVMCGKRDTEYVRVREGEGPTLDRASRALKRLGFFDAESSYSYPFTFATHQTYVRTTVWWGDTSKTVETYGSQGPVNIWAIERLVFGLADGVRWKKESRKPLERD